jgi:hypothetical protein
LQGEESNQKPLFSGDLAAVLAGRGGSSFVEKPNNVREKPELEMS